jgi:hypothetical protein
VSPFGFLDPPEAIPGVANRLCFSVSVRVRVEGVFDLGLMEHQPFFSGGSRIVLTDCLTGREIEIIGGFNRYEGDDVEGGRVVFAVAIVRDVESGRTYKVDPTNLGSDDPDLPGLQGVEEVWDGLKRQGKIK